MPEGSISEASLTRELAGRSRLAAVYPKVWKPEIIQGLELEMR
jgi:hypothetical protein